MLYIVTLEPFEGRYTQQWYEWYLPRMNKELEDMNAPFQAVYIDGDTTYTEITTGSFLDVAGTSIWKNEQLTKISKMFKDGTVKKGDIFFFMDAWFPGVESIRYMSQGMNVPVIMTGCVHAGTYDSWDFTTQQGMRPWGMYFESMMYEVFDKLYFATDYNSLLFGMNTYYTANGKWKPVTTSDKLLVTGFPLYGDFTPSLPTPWQERNNVIVFPHRKNIEKGSGSAELLAPDFAAIGFELVFATDVCETKQEYYDLLSASKFTFSCSEQETWGIAMQEAVYLGSIPLVPNRLSYPEMYYKEFIYTTLTLMNRVETISKTTDNGDEVYLRLLEANKEKLVLSNTSAIVNMAIDMYTMWVRK